MARWIDAEDRLHPIALADPEAYERYLRLLRIVADELAPARTHEQLLDAYGSRTRSPCGRSRARVRRRRPRSEPRDDGRLRPAAPEVVAEQRSDEILRQVRAARSAGPLVVVDETGTVELGGFVPYRRLEMHLPDGAGLYSFVEPSPEADAPCSASRWSRSIQAPVVRLPTPIRRRSRARSPSVAWESAVADLRHQIGETAS